MACMKTDRGMVYGLIVEGDKKDAIAAEVDINAETPETKPAMSSKSKKPKTKGKK